MTRLAPLIVTTLLALAAEPAGAGTVSTRLIADDDGVAQTATFTAAPGEANRLLIRGSDELGRTRTPPAVVSFRDDAEPIGAGPCRQEDANTAVCAGGSGWEPWRYADFVYASLGDGDDTAQADGISAISLRGGPGRDVLSGYRVFGEEDDDVLTGTELDGGPGNDVLSGVNSQNVLAPGPGDDAVRGKGSRDTVSYAAEAGPLRIDLAGGKATEPGVKADVLEGIEDATGGAGDDVLLGTGGSNRLEGRAGADRVMGGPGLDELVGGGGRDVLDGGAGDDVIDAGDLDDARDEVRCGAGNDGVIAFAFATNRPVRDGVRDVTLASDCELVHTGPYTTIQAVPAGLRGGRAAKLAVHCDDPCSVLVTLAVDGRRIGTGRAKIDEDGTVRVPLKGAPRGRLLSVRTETRMFSTMVAGFRVRLR